MVKMFPEPGHRLWLIIVGVESLPFFKIKGSFGHFLKWISFLLYLGFIFCRFLLFLFFFLLLRLFLSFFSFLLSPLPENSANFLASNSAILVHKLTWPITALALGWLTTVLNHLVTFTKGFLNSGSKTWV